MKKISLFLILTACLSIKMSSQISILGPTFVRNYNPTHGNWVTDPLSNSGRIWVLPSYNNQIYVYEYSNMANLIGNVVAQTYTLPLGYAGTGAAVYGGYLYYNKNGGANLVKYSLATQSVVLDVPLPNAGSMNTYAYQWGGYSDIDLATDENGLYVIYSTVGNSGNIVITKLDPNTLTALNTYSTATTKNTGNCFMVQGVNYSLASYSNINTNLNYKYNTLTGTGAAASITFTNGNSYCTSLAYNFTTKILYAWNNAALYTYTVVNTNSITAVPSTTALCMGNTLNVTYNAAGSYTAVNTFSAQLSDAAGSFTGVVTPIGVLTSTAATGVITATIPLGIPSGTAYRIRVSANNPGIIGENSGPDLTIAASPTINIAAPSTTVCYGAPLTLTASGAASYTWSNGSLTNTTVITPTANTTYSVAGTNTVGCANFTTQAINVVALPSVSITGASSVCAGSSLTLTVSGANTYSWSNGAITNTIVVTPTSNVTYTATGTSSVSGCMNSTTQAVAVAALPSVSITAPATICVGQSATLTASGANTYSWSNGSTNTSVVVSPTTTTSYTATGTSTAGCSNTNTISLLVVSCTGLSEFAEGNLQILIYPNPNNGEFTIELNDNSAKTVEVSDPTGRVIISQSSSESRINVAMNNLASGIYYVSVKSNGSKGVYKVVKQ